MSDTGWKGEHENEGELTYVGSHNNLF